MGIGSSVLEAIGNTSLVELRRVVPPGSARIFVKVEGENPTGSMKDRMAQSMIARAERDGRLKPGDTIVESPAEAPARRSRWSAPRRATGFGSSPPLPSARKSWPRWRRSARN